MISIKDKQNSADRRSFLKGMGMTTVGIAGAGLVGHELVQPAQKVAAATYSDLDLGTLP